MPAATVVPYIGTWIETENLLYLHQCSLVVPYIGTWIETLFHDRLRYPYLSYLI